MKALMNKLMTEFLMLSFFLSFFLSLELVIKSRDSISGFCEKAGIDRAMLYQIINDEREPRVDTRQNDYKTLKKSHINKNPKTGIFALSSFRVLNLLL